LYRAGTLKKKKEFAAGEIPYRLYCGFKRLITLSSLLAVSKIHFCGMFILRYNFADPELFNHYLSHRDRIVLAKSWRNSRDEGSQLVDWCKVPETP
jgi:hypothetical protein